METKEFKSLFDQVAKSAGFSKGNGGWFLEKPETITVLELQKSSFADTYYLNIKVFIQGAFGVTYKPDKALMKNPSGHVTNQVRDVAALDLRAGQTGDARRIELQKLFEKTIVPFVNKTSTISSLRESHLKAEIFLLPAVKQQLGL
ncbi:MAG TPA: DUF4304 domain-containing protein [Chryseosolibacter sp.]|nr:DUF4304 domain-containing protein [Chryseosolibacter sp.]